MQYHIQKSDSLSKDEEKEEWEKGRVGEGASDGRLLGWPARLHDAAPPGSFYVRIRLKCACDLTFTETLSLAAEMALKSLVCSLFCFSCLTRRETGFRGTHCYFCFVFTLT